MRDLDVKLLEIVQAMVPDETDVTESVEPLSVEDTRTLKTAVKKTTAKKSTKGGTK